MACHVDHGLVFGFGFFFLSVTCKFFAFAVEKLVKQLNGHVTGYVCTVVSRRNNKVAYSPWYRNRM